METRVRRAVAADIPFLVEAALEADRSGGSISTYETLFGLDELGAREALSRVLEEDVAGQELCVSDAVIAERDGRSVGAITSWIEGEEGLASTLAKAAVLFSTIGEAVEREARPKLAALAEVAIPRTEGALQLESIYVAPSARGSGVLASLVVHLLDERGRRASARRAQILLAGRNAVARRAYEKLGFSVSLTRTGSGPRLLELLGDDSRVLMERALG